MISVADLPSRFDECTTAAEANATYKELYEDLGIKPFAICEDYLTLTELHRRTMERLQGDAQIAVEAASDPNRVHPRLLRNWAAVQGLPLAKRGRVSREVENAYRRAHDLPVLAEDPEPIVMPEGVTATTIRDWARAEGIDVGERGRLHKTLIAQYVTANEEQ